MNRTARHLLYAFILIAVFTVLLIAAARSMPQDVGHTNFYGQIATIAWAIGFATIFFSWARVDALAYGKSLRFAALFALLWPFFNIFTHVAYLLITRGLLIGTLASLKFFCFILASGIAWFALARALGSIF